MGGTPDFAPTIRLIESFNDGHGNLSIKVEATDDKGIASVTLQKISGSGIVSSPDMVPWPSPGSTVYAGTIRDVPPNAQVSWLATATDTIGQAATVNETGRVTYSSAFGAWCPATCLAGNPVNTATGNDTDISIDLAIPGPGDSAIIIDRTYNSQDERDGPFGRGSSIMYDMRLTAHDNPLLRGVQVRFGDGHTANFRQNGAVYEPVSPGNFDRVERIGSNYVLRLKDRSSFVFDNNGRLVETRTRNGVPVSLIYDGASKLRRIVDSAGREVVLTWNGGHITQIDAPENKTLSYTYAGARLTSFTDGRRGPPTTFQHDAADRITAVITPNGYPHLQQQLDDRGRVMWQIIGERERIEFTYNDAARTTEVKDLDGTTTYTYDRNYFLKQLEDKHGEVATFRYDDRGNLRQRTDRRGSTWEYDYDANGNRVLQIDPPAACGALPYDSDITRWRYDAFSQIISKTDSLDFTWLYTYSPQGDLLELLEPTGALTAFAYNSLGQTTAITDANQHRTEFFYDQYGNQRNVKDAATNVLTVTFDLLGRVTSQSDANNHTTRFFYDGNDNITRTIDPRDHAWSFVYDHNNNFTALTDRRGIISRFGYDRSDNLVEVRAYLGALPVLYGYDARNRLISVTDQLRYTSVYTYDALDRLTALTDRAGATLRYKYDVNGNQTGLIDPLGAPTTYEYDAVNRLSAETDALGSRVTSCYDSEDRLVLRDGPRPGERYSFTYDLVGRLTELTDPQGNTWASRYDLVGNRTAEIDPLGHQTDYSYDPLDRLSELVRPVLPNGSRPTTRYGYDPVGNLVELTSPRGYRSAFSYDENDNLLTARDATGATRSFSYDEEDQQLIATDAKGIQTALTYGSNGLPTAMRDGRGFTTRYAYDAADNLTMVENALGHPTRYAYDAEQRLISASDPLGHTTLYQRDLLGRVTAVEDANSHRTLYSYDILGRLIAVTDGNGAPMRYAYDEVDNLIAITDANGNSTYFRYSLLNQLLEEENPLGKRWSYAYNPAGRQIRRVDALGHPTSYAFDSNDRLVGIQYGATAAEMAPVTFGYDADGNQTAACNGLGCITHTYDAVGRRLSTTDQIGRVVRRSYDAEGNLLALTYPDGKQARYAYDQTNRPVGLTLPGSRSSLFERDALGRVTQALHPNTLRSGYAYDEAGRLAGLEHGLVNVSVPLSAVAYSLDAVGNRTGVREARAAFDGGEGQAILDHRYSYDGADRLTRAATSLSVDSNGAGDRDTSYSFDPVGNRLALSGSQLTPDPGLPALPVAPRPVATSYEYNAANQLVRAGDTALSYDANGNRAQELRTLPDGRVETTDYIYDRENRLSELRKAVDGATTLTARYDYDSYGRRASKIVSRPGQPDEVTTFLYDGLEIIGERVETGDRSSERYYYLADSPITGMRRPFAAHDLTSDAVGWYITDGLDSVIGLTDKAGHLTSPSLYSDYGALLIGDSAATRFSYTGQDYDVESGLLHFHARYYDSARGVWLTQDSYRGHFEAPETLHRYGYVSQAPTSNYDYYGWVTFYVHGTHSDAPRAGSEDLAFAADFAKAAFDDELVTTIEWNSWYAPNTNGFGLGEPNNDKVSRSFAAVNLAHSILQYLAANPNDCDNINLIGHSHGGNVIIEALSYLQMLGIHIQNVALLGTPVRSDYRIPQGSVSNVYNIYAGQHLSAPISVSTSFSAEAKVNISAQVSGGSVRLRMPSLNNLNPLIIKAPSVEVTAEAQIKINASVDFQYNEDWVSGDFVPLIACTDYAPFYNCGAAGQTRNDNGVNITNINIIGAPVGSAHGVPKDKYALGQSSEFCRRFPSFSTCRP